MTTTTTTTTTMTTKTKTKTKKTKTKKKKKKPQNKNIMSVSAIRRVAITSDVKRGQMLEAEARGSRSRTRPMLLILQGRGRGLEALTSMVIAKAPFTRYNMLSNRLSNLTTGCVVHTNTQPAVKPV